MANCAIYSTALDITDAANADGHEVDHDDLATVQALARGSDGEALVGRPQRVTCRPSSDTVRWTPSTSGPVPARAATLAICDGPRCWDKMAGDEQAQFTWTSESGRHLCVSVFSWGFRWDNGDQELSARWEDVVELRGSPVRDVVYGSIPLTTHYGHWVVLADGRECGFGGTLGTTDSLKSANESLRAIHGVTKAVTIEQLGRIFTARVTSVLLPGAISRLNAGQSTSFGPLTVGPTGITAGDESVAWDQVKDVRTRDGRVYVKKVGRWRAWKRVLVLEIPNYFVFDALVRAVLAQRPAAGRG